MNAADKKLNEMNRLADMAHFPPLVNAGATLNVLLTVSVTWYLQPWLTARLHTVAPAAWIALVLAANLLPVVLLRLTLGPDSIYPSISRMNFVHDQHKFSDWVYLAASANMAFWVLGSWTVFTVARTPLVLASVLAVALLATFSPVLVRGLGARA
jgi:hypothetical protein